MMWYNKKFLALERSMLVVLLLSIFSPYSHAGWLLQPGVGGSLADLGGGLGGSFDVNMRGYWLPVPEVGIGLCIRALFPLAVAGESDEARKPGVVLLGGPSIILRFGNDSAWGFARAGVFGSESIASDDSVAGLVASAGGGFVVAPRTLPFYFGFELDGALEFLGSARIRKLGLGAFIGWTL